MFYISVEGEQIYKPLDDLLILFSPKLTLEIGKAGSLEFDIPPVNPFYDKLNQLTTEVTVDMDSEEIFHGRVLSCERTFSNIKHVYCEGDLSYLIDSVQKGEQYVGTTHDLFNKIITNHNARVDAKKRFTVGTINIENRSVIIVGKSTDTNINVGLIDYKQIALDSIADEWNNSFDYIQTCLIDYCGGYLRTRRVNGTNYIDLLADFESNATQEIELGKNVLDLSEELSVEDVFTVLVPLGDDNLTIATVNGGSDELVDSAAVAKYGRIVRTHVFNSVTNAYTLLENGRRFLAANLNIPRTVTVRAIDLHLVNKNINPIKIGDKVEITSYVHEVSDVLMCTKIEYDLEHPENNNYTFGNPKQTLTQRYREDQRASSSASAASASASGAAAAAAAKKAETEKDKSLQDFYDAWIKCDSDTGQISLGALYKKYLGDRQVLISQCGIDLDGATGNVDITSLHKQVNDQGRIIAENTARIGIVETDTSVAIENITDRQDHLATVEATHHTEVTQRCDELGSAINLMARDINEFEDRTTTATANINMRADDLESRIGINASYISQIDGRESSHFASIQVWANETESAIQLKADKVYVDGLLEAERARVDSLMSGNATAQHLLVNTITANSIKLKAGAGVVDVATTVHSHRISASEGSDGKITISIGTAVTDIPQKTSFNIADTKYFKDHVSAVNIKSFSLDGSVDNTDGVGYRYETANKRFLVYVKAILDNDTEKSGGPLYVNARAPYNAGVDAGAKTATISSVTIGSAGQPSKSDEDNVYYARVRVTAVAEGTKSDNTKYTNSSYSRNVSIDVTEVYNAGKAAGSESGSDDVGVTSLGFDPDEDYWYSASVDYYYIPIKTVLSNNKFRTTTISVPGDAAKSTVSVTGMRHYTVSGEDTVTYDSDNKVLKASVQATLSNGNTQGRIRTVSIPATLAYTAGANDVKVDENKLNTNWTESSTGYIYETANKRYRVRLIANLSNNKSFGATIYIPATDAYNAGVNSASDEVTISSIAINTGWATSSTGYYYQTAYKRYAVNVKATASNENYSTNTLYVPATDAYNAGVEDGKTTGAADVSCKTLGLDTGWSTSSTGYIYQTANKRYAVRGKATLSNGVTYSATMYVPATDAYNAGVEEGQATGESGVTCKTLGLDTSWSTSSTGYFYQTANKRYAVRGKATLSNGVTYSATMYVPAADAYDAGYNAGVTDGTSSGSSSVYVTALSYYTVSGEQTVSYDSTNKTLIASVQATLSNGNTQGSVRSVTIPATLAYNAGYNAGVSDGTTSGAAGVYVTAMKHYTVSGEQTVSYDSSNKTLTASVQATLSNGNTQGSVRSVTIPATLAYNAGYNAVTVSSVAMDGTATYQSGYKRYAVNVIGTAENGATKTSTIYVSATDAYNAGAASVSSASVSSVSITRQTYNDYYWTGSAWHIPVNATVYLSDGTSEIYSGDITVQDVVNAASSSSSGSIVVQYNGYADPSYPADGYHLYATCGDQGIHVYSSSPMTYH